MTRSRESSARLDSSVREKEQRLGARARSSTTANSESCVYDGVPRWGYAACALADFAPDAMHAGRRADFVASSDLARSIRGVDRPHPFVGSASLGRALGTISRW